MLHSSWGDLIVSADDDVGGGWSNLFEGVELSLTTLLPENYWYAVPLQQPVREQSRRHTFIL